MVRNGYGISKMITSSDGQYRAFGKCKVVKLIYSGFDSSDGWIKCWDGAPATGTLLMQIYYKTDITRAHELELNTYCPNGVYVEVNGSNIGCTVVYDYL